MARMFVVLQASQATAEVYRRILNQQNPLCSSCHAHPTPERMNVSVTVLHEQSFTEKRELTYLIDIFHHGL